jgi:hypothetical protein
LLSFGLKKFDDCERTQEGLALALYSRPKARGSGVALPALSSYVLTTLLEVYRTATFIATAAHFRATDSHQAALSE